MAVKRVKYDEGQWFAVPLRYGGYATGIIVRGSYKTKGGLGYFFGPKFDEIPDDEKTWEKHPQEAVLVTQFGDLGIINGRWPLILSTRPFSKNAWPIPLFGAPFRLTPEKAYIREYQQDNSGRLQIVHETIVDAEEVIGMPSDTLMGGGAVEIQLSELLLSK